MNLWKIGVNSGLGDLACTDIRDYKFGWLREGGYGEKYNQMPLKLAHGSCLLGSVGPSTDPSQVPWASFEGWDFDGC